MDRFAACWTRTSDKRETTREPFIVAFDGKRRLQSPQIRLPPHRIDGVDRATFSLRDLASGAQLAWRAVPNQSAPPTAAALKSLIDNHGPPLLLKSDNSSAFKDQETQQMLVGYGMAWLPSPPRMPQYNGGCEAGDIGDIPL